MFWRKTTPSEQENLEAVQQDGLAIQYIKKPSEAVQLAAVRQDGEAIKHIKKPSEAVQLAAVRQEGSTIGVIENPSEEMKLAAVQQDGWAIVYIENPSEEVCLKAVRQNGLSIKEIKNPSEEVQLAAFSHGGGFFAAGFWTIGFRPSVPVLTQAIQESGHAFNLLPLKVFGAIPDEFYQKTSNGFKVVRAWLVDQPANDILDLAAVAPALFEPPELREILRNALLAQAEPSKISAMRRSI